MFLSCGSPLIGHSEKGDILSKAKAIKQLQAYLKCDKRVVFGDGKMIFEPQRLEPRSSKVVSQLWPVVIKYR